MPGVREDLILDITSAQRSIDALEAQVTAAFSSIDITIDTAGISQEISRAVEAADTGVAVTADTTGISSEISRAVDVADTEVDVSADTAAARVEVNKLDRDLKETTGSASALQGVLTGAALVAGARGLFSLAEASSALNEQITGSEIVFGNAAAGVQAFADQADRIGLANTQALQLSNTFGQLALSAGLAGTEVSDFATTIVERGADIASLRDIDLTQTLEALRSGLVGETEPLRNIGIFMNEALVQSEAYRLGIAELGEELTDAQKIQARYQITLDQSAIAAGNFALTQEGLANTQRQIRAELSDLAAESGRLLEPTFLRLAQLARDELIPSLAELGEEALPAVGSILESLAPILGVTLDLLVALTPLLEVTADVLDAIPDPLIAIAAGFLAINKAQKLANFVGLTPKLGLFSKGIDGVASSFRKLDSLDKGVAIGASIAALATVTAIGVEAGAADGLSGLAGSIFEIGDALTGASSGRAAQLSADLEKLIGGFDTTQADQSLLAVRRLQDELRELGDVEDSLVNFGDKAIFNTTAGRNANELAEALDSQVVALHEAARAEIEAGIATGRFTDAQLDATAAQATREDPTNAIIRQLQLLQIEEERAARNAASVIDQYDDVAAAYIDTGDALERLRNEAAPVADALSKIRTIGDTSPQSFLNLATAIDDAGLSAEGLADTAALLGTDAETLAGFVDTLTGALDSFVQAAVSGLPTVGDVVGEVQEQVQAAEDELAASQERQARDVEASVSQFAAGLRAKAEELADFRSDLEALTAAGFADVAGLLAEQGFEAGDAFADELAAALAAGNTDIIEALRESNQAFEDETTATVDFIRDTLGPELLSVTGLISSAITESFGEGLDFEEKIRIASELAKAELDPQGEQIAAIAATKGESAARAFGEALKFDEETIDAGVAAGLQIKGTSDDPYEATGERLGGAFGAGLVSGILAQVQAARNAARILALAAELSARATAGIRSPSKVWTDLGGYMAEGMVVGLTSGIPAVASAGAKTVASAVPAFGTRSFTPTGAAGRMHPDDIAALATAIGGSVPPGGDTWNITEAASATATATAVHQRTRRRAQRGR